MNTRTLGTDLTVSAVGLGCMGFSHAYGAPTERGEAVRAIRAAYDLGYTLFDTAETYGTAADPHDNEKLVGEALKDVRDKVQIVTKFGIRFDETSTAVNKPLIPDSRPETIRSSVEGSLRRLGTGHIDLYFQHRMDPNVEPETVAQVMADLIKEGKITHWGISEADETYLRRAHAVCPATAVQNRYSMMARWHEALFPVLEELHVGFVAFSPMANGLLTGAYGKDSTFDPRLDYQGYTSPLCYIFSGRSAPLPRSCSWNALFIERNLQKTQILRGNKTNKGHSFRKGVPFKWSKSKPICGISVVKREIAVVFTTAISIFGGLEGDRTLDLCDANAALSQSGKFPAHGLRCMV